MTVPAPPASSAVDLGAQLESGSWTRTQVYLVALTALTIIVDGAENQLLFGSRATMLPLALGAAMALAISWFSLPVASPMTTVVLLGIIGALINAVQTALYVLAADIYPTAVRATGVGAAVAVGRGGAILSSYAGALALDGAGVRLFFVVVAAAMLAAALALSCISRHIAPARRPVFA